MTQQIRLNYAQQKLVDRILERLEEGEIPWKSPWKHVNVVPYNATTSTKYKGFNQVSLMMEAFSKGYQDPRWCTFKQAKEKGWRIKKGSQGVSLYYPLLYNHELKRFLTAKDFEGLDDKESDKLKAASTLRDKSFTVFNAEQLVGIEKLPQAELVGVPFESLIAKQVIRDLEKNMDIVIEHEEQDRAYYNKVDDRIKMPHQKQFLGEQGYYATLFHEISHATGHEERLNRDLSGSFGSAEYAQEELVAEFSSLFLSQKLGLPQEQSEIDNGSAYIASWMQVLKDNPQVLALSINKANQAYNYVYDKGNIKSLEDALEKIHGDAKKDLKNVRHNYDKSNKVDVEVLRRDVLITDYAQLELGLNLTPNGKNRVSTQEHDSLVIYTDKNDFFRYSTQTGGDIINFVMHFKDLEFKEALNDIQGFYHKYQPSVQETKTFNKQKDENIIASIELPEPAKDNKQVINYLSKTRCLPAGLVQDFIDEGYLYQDSHDNCVFVGKFEDMNVNAVRRAAKKSSNFKADVEGSYKQGGFYYGNDSKTLIVTEGVIDAMSLMAIRSDYKSFDYLSVNGVGNTHNALKFQMDKREGKDKYERIIFALDNDDAGQDATLRAIKFMNNEYPGIDVEYTYPESKDWNAELIHQTKKHDDPTYQHHHSVSYEMGGKSM
ncbi:DUF1738 domain-containing protein [Erysipelothrix sp. HDW6A]|uniref:zincin-like metallopeptidase domain-containing protein n=1 Tax=Erysipelothrix sp. HDW6A TaxID=2714928 RepID=UPI001409A2D8|nr:zincin-like metallopeptidase domain-containing protein [Erysipelothrix sp. HDW6A]QIK56344.1 DUF1738 domain-containing protein [Erysipelothrix sp. HDW6A]